MINRTIYFCECEVSFGAVRKIQEGRNTLYRCITCTATRNTNTILSVHDLMENMLADKRIAVACQIMECDCIKAFPFVSELTEIQVFPKQNK